MAKSRLADILKQEYKTKGLISGGVSAVGKSLKEKMDLRNVFFGGTGIGSIIGRKIFGKGYSATPDSSVASKISAPEGSVSSESVVVLKTIATHSATSAKNSIVLPSMARDMHLVKQNIAKLVKLSGGTPQTKSGDWLNRQMARETAYENSLNSNEPTPVNAPEKPEAKQSFLQSLLGPLGILLMGTFSTLSSIIKEALSTLGGLIVGALRSLGELLLGRPITTSPSGPSGTGPGNDKKGGGKGTGPKTGPSGIPGTPGQPGSPGGTTPQPSKGNETGKTKEPGKASQGKPWNAQKRNSKGQFVKKSIWAKFLTKVEKKFGEKIALKLASMAGLAAVPVAGWVVALIGIGLNVGFAYELYKLWKETEGEEEASPMKLNAQQTEMANLIYSRFIEAGFSDAQARAAVANAYAESSLNPNAHNEKGEDSVGLFQMNRQGGLGKGYSVEQLKDPETNIQLAIAAAKKSKNFMAAESVEDATKAFVHDVERPKDKAGASDKRIQLAQNMMSNNFGEKVDGASRGVSDGNRVLASAAGKTTNYVDGSVTTNNMSSPQTGPVASVYNQDFNELLAYANRV